MRLFSPAKINVVFHVLGKREDGYHEIASLMQAVSFGDTITFSCSDEDELTFRGVEIPTDRSNLIYRALDLFRKKTGWQQKLAILVEKKIPVGAGLGGGSSNAATTLWALNELSQMDVEKTTLQTWSAEIGSDVPFFFSNGSALCEGRGEKITEYPILVSAPLHLALNQHKLATPEVYSRVKEALPRKNFVNDLEEAAFSICPQLKEIKSELQNCFSHVMLTGSGSSFYCIGEIKKNINDVTIIPVQPLMRKNNNWYEG